MFTINCEENIILKAKDVPLETVEEFLYLDSIGFSDGGITIDILRKINKARGVWRSKNLKLKTYYLVSGTVKTVLLYISETCLLTKAITKKL